MFMKTKFLFFFAFIYTSLLFSQIVIEGKVFSNTNEPLEGAFIYFSNTSIGTLANSNGEFRLKIKEGNYDLVVSYLGFKSSMIKVRNSSLLNVNVKLYPSNDLLDEVTVKKVVYDQKWRDNLLRFKKAFFGGTKFADECFILNEKDIRFEFDSKTKTLTAFARKPLLIENHALGYLITYDLVDFSLNDNKFVFHGYSQFKNLKKYLKKKWIKNRKIAYNGSRMHFFRSLLNKNHESEGFRVDHIKRAKNNERPSDEKIRKAEAYFEKSGETYTQKKIKLLRTALDSATNVLNKAKLPKYRDYLYQRNITNSDIVSVLDSNVKLNFKNSLLVTYIQEKEEETYRKRTFNGLKEIDNSQASTIMLLEGPVTIFPFGVVEKPTSVYNKGYWIFEAFAHSLPLDYDPYKN